MSFITTIAPLIQKYALQNGYLICSPIIAQAIGESNQGKSELAIKAYNFFGLKDNNDWNGDKILYKTKEEYVQGKLVQVEHYFRKFKNMEDGVKGYFQFINNSRYSNLRKATTPKQYLEYLKADNYATSSNYVDKNLSYILKYNLTSYDYLVDAIVSNGHGSLSPQYLFVHETANPNASALNHIKYWNNSDTYAVHYVCDWTNKIYHAVPDNRKCYHVGNANNLGVGIEICNSTNKKYFSIEWELATTFCAWYLNLKSWGIERMMSHNEARLKWGGTTHTDPDGYFKQNGKTWVQFKQDVQKKMKLYKSSTKTAKTTTTITATTLSHYDDLRKAGLTTEKQLLDHFIKFGMNECRQANAEFNVKIYQSNYADLRNAFGNDYVKYYQHYCTNGKGEKRIANKKI